MKIMRYKGKTHLEVDGCFLAALEFSLLLKHIVAYKTIQTFVPLFSGRL